MFFRDLGRYFKLEKTLVGVFLNINQVGDINDVLDFGEVFTQEVVIGNRISHMLLLW